MRLHLLLLVGALSISFSSIGQEVTEKDIDIGTALFITPNSIFESLETQNAESSLYLNGISPSNGEEGYSSVYANLGEGFDYGQFTMSLNFHAVEFNSEEDRSIIVGGFSYRWFSLRWNNGALEVTLNNQSDVYTLDDLKIEPGKWHNVVATVDIANKEVRILLDGRYFEIVELPADFTLEVVEANVSDHFLAFHNNSNGDVFHGFVSQVKAFATSFNLADMWLQYNQDKVARYGK